MRALYIIGGALAGLLVAGGLAVVVPVVLLVVVLACAGAMAAVLVACVPAGIVAGLRMAHERRQAAMLREVQEHWEVMSPEQRSRLMTAALRDLTSEAGGAGVWSHKPFTVSHGPNGERRIKAGEA